MLFSYDVFSHSVFLNITRGAVLEGPEKFSHPESRSKILNLMIKELLYSHVLNTIRSSIPYKKFQAYTPLCFKYRLTKIGFSGPKSYRVFRETCPWSRWTHTYAVKSR